MRRVFWLLCLLVALACPLPDVQGIPTRPVEPGPAADTPVPQPRWRAFAPPGGRFTVLLPATPVALVGSEFHTCACSANDVRYIVQYDDQPAKDVQILGAEKFLTITDAAVLQASHGKVIRKSRLTRGGSPGVEIVALRTRGRQETFRAYLVGNRLYHLMAVYLAGDAAAEADVGKFLDSFTLVPPALVPSPTPGIAR